MPNFKTPGVYIEEIPSGAQQIHPAATDITVFIGYSPKGPTKRPVLLANFLEFERQFGKLSNEFLLGLAVNYFFQNGGTKAFIIRLECQFDKNMDHSEFPNSQTFLAALFPPKDDGGVKLLPKIDSFNLLNVPGLTDFKTIHLLQEICSNHHAFLIVDPPKTASVESLEDDLPGGIRGEHARNSAMYYPWILVSNGATNGQITIPPGGFVAGIFVHNDAVRGVWKAPAGIAAYLNGSISPSPLLNDNESVLLNPLGVNSIRQFPTYGTIIWGARTLATDTEWIYVPVRRFYIFIEQSIRQSIQWAVFEPNDEPLWAEIRGNINEFLRNLFMQGAFAGNKPDESFYVKCGHETTTQADIDSGIFTIELGFAPTKPAEFIVMKIQQKAAS